MIKLFPGEFREIELREKYPISNRYNLLLRSSGCSYTVLSLKLDNLMLWMWYNSNKLNKYIPLSVIKEFIPVLIHGQPKGRFFGGAWFGGGNVKKPDIMSSSGRDIFYDSLQILYPNAYLTRYDFLNLIWNKFRTHLYINNINDISKIVETQVQEFGEFTYYNM